MNLPPNQVPPADTLADVRTRITALYAIHALEIAGSLGGKPLCVVTGPRRFGKTTSLLPGLASILRGRGNTTHIMNGRDFEQEPLTVRALPGEQVDVLIVDEANVLTRTVKKTEIVLRLLHTKATAVVPVITFDAGYEPGSICSAHIWQDAEYSIGGEIANIICLPQMIVIPIPFSHAALSAGSRWRFSVIQCQPVRLVTRSGSASSSARITSTAATLSAMVG